MNKYELLKEESVEVAGRVLYRIRALRNLPGVLAGDKGGYIESEQNLSQEGNCWVYETAGFTKMLGFSRMLGFSGMLWSIGMLWSLGTLGYLGTLGSLGMKNFLLDQMRDRPRRSGRGRIAQKTNLLLLLNHRPCITRSYQCFKGGTRPVSLRRIGAVGPFCEAGTHRIDYA